MATLNTRIQLRNDTAARWEQVNPVLYSGEFGFEKDTGLFKVGDGKSAWNSLPYANNIYSYNASQLTLDGHTLGLKGYGEKYYARKDDNTYELVDVDEEHPWKAGLTPRVVEEQGELTIGWFEESNSPAAIEGLKYEVVETLPEEPKDNVIYLVKDETVTAGDAYKEYLLIGEQLTQIGDTSVNLEGFVKDVNEDLFKIENGVLTSADKTLQAFDWEATRPFDKEYSVIGQTIYYDSAQFDDNGDVSNYLAEIDHTAKNFTVPNYPDGVRLLNKIHQDRVSGKYAKQVLVTRVRKPELVQDALIIGSTPTSVLVSRTNGKSAEHILIAYNTVEREFEISCYDHTSTASADAIKVRPYLPHEVFGEYYAYCPTDSWDLGQVKEACLGVESGKEVYLVFSENYTDLVDVEHKIVDYHGEHSTRGGDNADVMRVSFRAVSAKYIYDVSGYIVTAANGEILSQGSGLTIKRHKAYPSTIYVEAD